MRRLSRRALWFSLDLTRKSNKPRAVTQPKERPQARRISFAPAALRVVVVAVLALAFALYGLVRHFTHPMRSMLEPAGSVEIPAPEIEVAPDR